MPKIRNASGDDLVVPWLDHRLVKADEVVDVPATDAPAYLCQPAWTPADEDAEHLATLDAGVVPPLNASTDVWRAWSGLQPGADHAVLAGLTREQLQARYAPQRQEAPAPDSAATVTVTPVDSAPAPATTAPATTAPTTPAPAAVDTTAPDSLEG